MSELMFKFDRVELLDRTSLQKRFDTSVTKLLQTEHGFPIPIGRARAKQIIRKLYKDGGLVTIDEHNYWLDKQDGAFALYRENEEWVLDLKDKELSFILVDETTMCVDNAPSIFFERDGRRERVELKFYKPINLLKDENFRV